MIKRLMLITLLTAGAAKPPVNVKPERDQVMQGWPVAYDNYIVQQLSLYPGLVGIDPARMKTMCPKYAVKTASQKKAYWADLMYSIALPESSHHRALIYREGTMSNDSITGVQVRSEGLLQLSYQDKNSYGNACDFEWEKDKTKALADFSSGTKYGDGTRTIHNAYRNINCALYVFNAHVTKHAVSKPLEGALRGYWYVMRTEHKEPFARVMKALRERNPSCF